MSFDTSLQQNCVGITFIVVVTQQDGVTPQDISGATSLNMFLTKPDLSISSNEATFVTDGTDGKMQYTTQSGELSTIGIYKVQGEYISGSGVFYTQKTYFIVEPNF